MTSSVTTESVTTEHCTFVSGSRLVRAGAVATAAALLAVVFTRPLVGGLYELDPTLGPLQSLPLVASTFVAGLVTTVVYAALDRYTTRPARKFNFLAASAVVIVGTLVPVLTLAPSLGVTGDLQSILLALHAVVAAPIVALLIRLPGPAS
jgi:hypothetical protein